MAGEHCPDRFFVLGYRGGEILGEMTDEPGESGLTSVGDQRSVGLSKHPSLLVHLF